MGGRTGERSTGCGKRTNLKLTLGVTLGKFLSPLHFSSGKWRGWAGGPALRALLCLLLATRVSLTMSLHQWSEREDRSIKKYNPGVIKVVTKKIHVRDRGSPEERQIASPGEGTMVRSV